MTPGGPRAAPRIELVDAASPDAVAAAGALFREYADSLGVDLAFQHFDAELATLPGAYAPPAGALLLATVEGDVAGCGALRPIDAAIAADACEMKRLYVRPRYRGLGLGRRLAERLLDRARAAGYGSMLLDTMDDMTAARDLYASLGFVTIPPYYVNPVAGVHYLRAELAASAATRRG